MGAVYEAFDPLGVKVALKLIRPEVVWLGGAALEARFKRELLLARAISHKHVIRIHDLGDVEGTLDITMRSSRAQTSRASWTARGGFPGNVRCTSPARSLRASRRRTRPEWPTSI